MKNNCQMDANISECEKDIFLFWYWFLGNSGRRH